MFFVYWSGQALPFDSLWHTKPSRGGRLKCQKLTTAILTWTARTATSVYKAHSKLKLTSKNILKRESKQTLFVPLIFLYKHTIFISFIPSRPSYWNTPPSLLCMSFNLLLSSYFHLSKAHSSQTVMAPNFHKRKIKHVLKDTQVKKTLNRI